MKDENLLPLTSAFTDGIFMPTWTQLFSAHAVSARNAQNSKVRGSSGVRLAPCGEEVQPGEQEVSQTWILEGLASGL